MRLDDDSLTDIREYIAEEIGKQILIKLGCAFAMFALFSIWLPLSLIGPQRDSSGISSMFPNFILVFSVLMFLMAISELRTPRRVVLTGSHILIEGWLTRILLRWSDIHEIRIDDKSEYGKREKLRVLTLMDSRGKKCGQINSNIRGYASLEKQIQSRSSASRGNISNVLYEKRLALLQNCCLPAVISSFLKEPSLSLPKGRFRQTAPL